MDDSGRERGDHPDEAGQHPESEFGANRTVSGDISVFDAQQRLSEIGQEDAPFEQKAREALELGRQCLGADDGHLTRIDTETDHREVVVSTGSPDGRLPPGHEPDTDDSYCRRTLASDEHLVLDGVPSRGSDGDTPSRAPDDHHHLGTTLRIDDDPFGTVCFVAEGPREEPFTESQTVFAELVARTLERELERDEHRAELTRQTNLVNVLNRVLRHNLRNDLTVVRGRAKLLMDRVEEETHGDVCLRVIDELIELSEKARDLEQVVGRTLDREETDVVALVERVVDELAREFPDSSFTVEHDGDVTAAVGGSFKRAVEELVENAAKHGGDAPTVTIAVEADPDTAEVRVTDGGSGLEEMERKVLAKGTETPLVHGTGLGLWIARWIVSKHDGEIEAETGNDGTTMTLSVPRSPGTGPQRRVAELRRARDRYRSAFEGAFDGMVIFDDDARIMDANPEAAAIYGLDRDDLLGRRLEEFLPEEVDFQGRWAALKRVGAERDTVTYIGADGIERPVEYSATTDIIPGQHLLVLRDITERKRREQALEQRRDMLRYAEQVANVGAVEVDPQSEAVEWTDGTRSIHGVADDYEPDVESALEFFVPPDREAVQRRFEQCLETGESYSGEYRIWTADDETRWVDFYAEPRQNDGGAGIIRGAIQDITERKRRESELEGYERLVENLPVGVFRTTLDGEFVSMNGALRDIYNAESFEQLRDVGAEALYVDSSDHEQLLDRLEDSGRVENERLDIEAVG